MAGPGNGRGAGYNDPEKMKAAMELAQSFKKGSSMGGSSMGGSMGGSLRSTKQRDRGRLDYADDRRSSSRPGSRSKSGTRPLPIYTNVPPPSLRNYTNTLISDTSQLGSGPIMGSKVMDFLRRQDKSPVPQKPSATQGPQKRTEVATGLPATAKNGGAPRDNGHGLQDNKGTASTPIQSPQEVAVDRLRVPETSNGRLTPQPASQEVQNGTGISQNTSFAPVQGSQSGSQSRSSSRAKGNILDTFMALLNEESPEAQIEPLPAANSNQPNVEVNSTSKVTEQSTMSASECSKGPKQHAPEQLEEKSATSSSSQAQNGGKPNGTDQQRDQNLRPSARVFTPERHKSKVAPEVAQPGTPGQGEHSGSSRLSPEASPWTPREKHGTQQCSLGLGSSVKDPVEDLGLPSQDQSRRSDQHMLGQQDASNIVPLGPACGHVISVTPVSFANGFLLPGRTTGQLWLQTPVAMGASSATASSNPPAPQKRKGEPRKPTVGLKGSKWA